MTAAGNQSDCGFNLTWSFANHPGDPAICSRAGGRGAGPGACSPPPLADQPAAGLGGDGPRRGSFPHLCADRCGEVGSPVTGQEGPVAHGWGGLQPKMRLQIPNWGFPSCTVQAWPVGQTHVAPRVWM